MSRSIAASIFDVLEWLRDPNNFPAHIQALANDQGIAADLPSPAKLYGGFWTLANGMDTDFNWRSDAGVPARAKLFVRSFVVPPPHAKAVPEFKEFGCRLGTRW